MNPSRDLGPVTPAGEDQSGMSRRSFFRNAAVVGATTAVALGGLPTLVRADNPHQGDQSSQGSQGNQGNQDQGGGSPTKGDLDILAAAQIAEALAVTTYTNIINTAPFFTRLEDDDQGYLKAARQEEMSHYLLEQSVTRQNTPFTSFFYPQNMFADAQTTLNTLVTLEDAFIAAYLVGVRNFSTSDLRVTAARIMGIESDHRILARVLAPDVAAQDGGPIETITGAQGVAEDVDPPNNNAYERTLCWTQIGQALQALMPFVDKDTATQAGFDVSKPFSFEPFTPVLPNPLGDFISFTGC